MSDVLFATVVLSSHHRPSWDLCCYTCGSEHLGTEREKRTPEAKRTADPNDRRFHRTLVS